MPGLEDDSCAFGMAQPVLVLFWFGRVITNHIGSMRLAYLPTFSWFLLGKLVRKYTNFRASHGYLWVIFIQKSLFQSMRIQPIQRWWFFVLGLPQRRNITDETPVVGTVVLLGSGVFFRRHATCDRIYREHIGNTKNIFGVKEFQ